MSRITLLVILYSAAFLACAGQNPAALPTRMDGPSGPESGTPVNAGNAENLVEQKLVPAEIDPAATQFPAPEYAYTPATGPRADQLVVYLVGSKGVPTNGRSMGRYLAGLGFPVVIPGYPNDYDIRKLCEKAPDDACHGKLRLEAFEGKDHSPHIAVAPADSTETRVAQMLKALEQRLPAAGWGKFLDGDKPRWDQIIVAGHSHGASSAALIAKHRKVFRAIMLSGPFDNRNDEAAEWTRRSSATPADRYYGLSHTQEEQHTGHLKDWAALGLGGYGAITNIDGAAPPYGGSRQLITALPAAEGGNAHGTTAAGKSSPKNGDAYRYDPVWRYLFGK